ncbi:hypothetical protein LSAT2_029589 [Lamellibrachia satsuma]|nr:hypothetical protein LSAT2_029589 [Lamellibrachia satsuma]
MSRRQIGESWLSGDCADSNTCQVCSSCTRPVGEIVKTSFSCPSGETCKAVDGVGSCQSASACPPNMEFRQDVLPCLPTCFVSDADYEENCELDRTDTCVCSNDWDVYWNATAGCIDAYMCPCEEYGEVFERDDSWYSDGCTTLNTCTDCDDCARTVGQIQVQDNFDGSSLCGPGEVCQTLFGIETCGPPVVVGGWGSWTVWSACTDSCGMGVQTRSRLCDNPPPANGGSDCIGSAMDNRECVCEWNFVPSVHCKTCISTNNIIGYVRDECRCGRYYQCELSDSGAWSAVKRDCPPCLFWNEEEISCSIRVPGCVAPSTPKPNTTPVPKCYFLAVPGHKNQYSQPTLGGQRSIITCSPGTEFVQAKCICVAMPPVAAPTPTREITCVNFDSGYNGFGSTNWVWIDAINMKRRSGKIGRAAFFRRRRRAHLEIPRFSNSYRKYTKFGVSFWYKRTGSYRGAQGLVANGNCVEEPSIGIKSHDGTISAQLITGRGKVTIADIPASNNEWHHVVLSYDGSNANLYVDNVAHAMGSLTGRIQERHCPMVIGDSSHKTYFNGYIDELCFYATGLTANQVDGLFNLS